MYNIYIHNHNVGTLDGFVADFYGRPSLVPHSGIGYKPLNYATKSDAQHQIAQLRDNNEIQDYMTPKIIEV